MYLEENQFNDSSGNHYFFVEELGPSYRLDEIAGFLRDIKVKEMYPNVIDYRIMMVNKHSMPHKKGVAVAEHKTLIKSFSDTVIRDRFLKWEKSNANVQNK